jgi:3-hydroxybutyryl-CoA dehydrogenase
MGEPLSIAIIGAGLMGHGIAQVFAAAGHRVRVYDAVAPALASLHQRIERNLQQLELPADCLSRVSGHADLAEAVGGADIIIEAAPEKLELKRALFADLERHAPANALIASNTSVIPISQIVEGCASRQRMLGTHWWNPPFLVPLVEVIGTPDTAPEAIARMIDLLASIGKTPVHVKKDVPGFVGNRLQHALWREAIYLVEAGICDAETVDTVVKASFGRRLAVLGPIGTDLTLDIHRTMLPELHARPAPSPYLEGLVTEGKLGMKSGQGFRSWTDEEASALRADVFAYLKAFRLPRADTPQSS